MTILPPLAASRIDGCHSPKLLIKSHQANPRRCTREAASGEELQIFDDSRTRCRQYDMRDSNPTRSARPGFWLLIAMLALFAAGKPILFDTLDPDCFWHLRVAEQLHRDGIGPIVDDLSFASSRTPWTPYSWLAELGMKWIWDFGGYRAAVGFTSIMQGMIIVLLACCCVEIQNHPHPNPLPEYRERGPKVGYLSAVIATAVGCFLILPYLSFRPVTMGFVLLFAIAWLILRDQSQTNAPQRREDAKSSTPSFIFASSFALSRLRGAFLLSGQRSIWLIVPLTVLLSNIHLFSFFVPAMVLAMAVGAMVHGDAKSVARYSILATATSLACLATPMLPGLVKTIFFYSASDKMVTGPVISEMQSFARGPMGWVAAIGVLAMLGCIAVRHHRLAVGQLICVGASALLMFKLGRFAPLFALAACPAMAATLPGLKDRILGKMPIIAMLSLICVLILGRLVISFPGRSVPLSAWVNRHGPDTPGYPCAAADFVDRSVAHNSGHLINEFSWGGFLAWRLEGKYRVLLDGRTQVYPQSLWQATYLGDDAERQKFLETVQADAALLPVKNSKFREELMHLGWTSAFKDDRAEVLIPPSTGLAASAASN